MVWILEHNPDASTYELGKYLEENGIVETKKGYFKVASGLKREEAINKLVDLAGDMLMPLDVMPSPVDPRGKVLHFANQFGIFYIDGIPDPKMHLYEKEMATRISNGHIITGVNIKQVDRFRHDYSGDIGLINHDENNETLDWQAEPEDKSYRRICVVPKMTINPLKGNRFTQFPDVDRNIRKIVYECLLDLNSDYSENHLLNQDL